MSSKPAKKTKRPSKAGKAPAAKPKPTEPDAVAEEEEESTAETTKGLTEEEQIARKANFKKYKKLAVASQKSPTITIPESLRSMNGIVRLMAKKYGQEKLINSILFCEPSRERIGFATILNQPSYLKTNHFSGMKLLVRKAGLANQLNFFRSEFSKDYSFYPVSWDLCSSEGLQQFRMEFDERKTYIIKPSPGHQGDGIILAQQYKQVAEYMKHNPRCIAQEYIPKPLLLGGFKFDFRVYVLVESLSPLRLHVFREGLARFCTRPYVVPTKENLNQDYMHLTNYSLNKASEEFRECQPYVKLEAKRAAGEGDAKQGPDDSKLFEVLGGAPDDSMSSKRRLSTALRQINKEHKDTIQKLSKGWLAALEKGKGPQQPKTEAEEEDEEVDEEADEQEVEEGDAKASKEGKKDGKDAKDQTTAFDKFFWDWIDRCVAKTVLALWRPLWDKYVDLFPAASRRNFHTPQCPNHPTNAKSAAAAPAAKGKKGKAAAPSPSPAAKQACECSHYSRCFHMIGFDVLLDEHFTPWLLEVNNNPSMHCRRSELDSIIKQGVFETALRHMGFLTHEQIVRANLYGRIEHESLSPRLLEVWSKPDNTPPERTMVSFKPAVMYPHIAKSPLCQSVSDEDGVALTPADPLNTLRVD